MSSAGTARDRPRPLFARYYAALTTEMDARGLGALRRELLREVHGRVVEIGCGNGCNFEHYPATVTSVRAVEPEPRLRALATSAATRAPVAVTVEPGRGEALPCRAASADAAVLCLVLCAMPQPQATLAEIHRVLRPGGTLVFLEHCAADSRGLRTIQRVLDATVWPRLTGGCRTAPDPVGEIRAAGFTITARRGLRYPERPPVPSSTHVIGRATRS